MEKRTKVLLIAVVAVATLSAAAVMLVGPNFTFKGKVESLSREYETLEMPLTEYVNWWWRNGIDVLGGSGETKDWGWFRDKLKQATYEGTYAGSIWYDRGSQRIWFAYYNEEHGTTIFVYRAPAGPIQWRLP